MASCPKERRIVIRTAEVAVMIWFHFSSTCSSSVWLWLLRAASQEASLPACWRPVLTSFHHVANLAQGPAR